MSPSSRALELLNEHWAVAAIGTDKLERAGSLVCQRLARRAIERQVGFSLAENIEDEPLLERVALAFELAAIEGLDELSRPDVENRSLREQSVAASFRVFDIRRTLPVPAETHRRLFFVLQFSAMACCGDRWSDLRRWYRDHADALRVPNFAAAEWDRRLLYRLFDCWVRLFRKAGSDDLDCIGQIIAGLRNDQKTHEEGRLRNGSDAVDRAIALRLVTLYNWAKCTETLARYMLRGEPGDPCGTLDRHFEAGIRAAAAAGDAQYEVLLRWLHATARIMVTDSF